MRTLSATLLAFGLTATAASLAADDRVLRWAATGDPETLDPHAAASAPVLGFLNNVYEGLVRRGRDMRIEPGLATEWRALGDRGWRFQLRRGVRFHDGAAFDADDVLFSYRRASGEDSDVRAWFAGVVEVLRVDDYTVDFITGAPNPLFPESIANFMIMDEDWATTRRSLAPARDRENDATLNANGTGAFLVSDRQPGVRTVLEPFADWWGESAHNLERAVFTPIANPATMVAALLSGDIDLIKPIPLQDLERIENTAGFKTLRGIEARVMMLGFAHSSDRLQQPIDAGNPLRRVEVRRAIYHAVDVDALTAKIMRGSAAPAGLLVSDAMNGYAAAQDRRLGYDPDRARTLLAEAGVGDGFSFELACPNDRYINDEAVCKAVAAMLARVGLEARLRLMPVRNYWPELRAGNFDMYLLGWSPGTFDAEHPLRFLMTTPNPEKKLGAWNFGGYSNPQIDDLLGPIQVELDPRRRQALIDQTHQILRDDVAYVPLYVQPLVWGMKTSVNATQRPDDFLILRWVTIEPG